MEAAGGGFHFRTGGGLLEKLIVELMHDVSANARQTRLCRLPFIIRGVQDPSEKIFLEAVSCNCPQLHAFLRGTGGHWTPH